ncbi:MAG: hypothetical protein ACRYF3_11645 [Janthinobacterium lividum]
MSLSYSVFIKAPRDYDLITAVLDKFFGQEHVDQDPGGKLQHTPQAVADRVLCNRPYWRITVPGGSRVFTVLLDENYMREFDPEEDPTAVDHYTALFEVRGAPPLEMETLAFSRLLFQNFGWDVMSVRDEVLLGACSAKLGCKTFLEELTLIFSDSREEWEPFA